MNGMAGAHGALTGAVRAVRDVLFSRGCAGCDAPDEVLCGTCMRGLVQPVCFDLPATVCGIGMACGSYHGPLRRAVLAWKDHGDAECDGPFSDAMVALLQAEPLRSTLDQVGAVAVVPAPSSWRSICTRGRSQLDPIAGALMVALLQAEPLRSTLDQVGAVAVVPAPSSWRSICTRGRSQLDPIAGALAERLCAWGVEAHVHRALEVRHIRTKSVQTASARGRRERVTGHIRCRNGVRLPAGMPVIVGVRLPAGMPVIVIDDIVTSGATMRECIDVLRAQGNPVLAALALAHTPPRAPEQS